MRVGAVEQRRGQRLHALDRDALGQLVEHLGELRVLARPARRPAPAPSAVSSSSRHGGAHSRVDLVDGALVGDGEGADLLDLVAPELDPRRVLVGGREDVEDAAADRELAALGDQVDPGVRHVGQPPRRRRPARPSPPVRSSTGSRSPRPLSCGCSSERTGATTTRSGRPRSAPGGPAGAARPAAGRPCRSAATAARAAASPRPGRPRPGRGRQAAQRVGQVLGLAAGRGHRQHRPAGRRRLGGRRPRPRPRTAAARRAR